MKLNNIYIYIYIYIYIFKKMIFMKVEEWERVIIFVLTPRFIKKKDSDYLNQEISN